MNISDLEKIDSEKMFKVYDKWPEIARESFEGKFKKIDVKDVDHIVFAGMGGSGSVGDTIKAILSKTDIHVTTIKGYILPKTVDSNTLVIATSVSGNTEETIKILENSQKSSAKSVGFSSGGLMEKYCKSNDITYEKIPMIHSPRASLPSFLFSILNILEPILPIKQNDVMDSILELEKTKKRIFSENLNEENLSLDLAKYVKNIVCINYPRGLEAAAIRYKNSLQENTKLHAMTEDVIETCHNGIVSWENSLDVSPVLIQGKDDHLKTIERWKILEKYFTEKEINFKVIKSVNGGILSKITNLVYLLDYSTIYSSVLRRIDPSPVESIDYVKSKL